MKSFVQTQMFGPFALVYYPDAVDRQMKKICMVGRAVASEEIPN